MKRCKPHRKYIAFCNLNIYIFFITICFQIFKTTFYLKLFCMRDIFYCMIWIAFFFFPNRTGYSNLQSRSFFIGNWHICMYSFITVKKKTLTKKKTIKKPQKQPLWESKHLNKPLIMQLVIPPLLPYDFKGTVLEIGNFRTTVL